MRMIDLKRSLGVGIALALALVLVGCGLDGDTGVRARNLLTGEIQEFASPEDVPPDWVTCETPDCGVPSTVPCLELSEKTCTLNPGCQWDQPVCPAVCEDDGKGGCKPCPAQGACHAKQPPACQQLTDVQSCSTRMDCEWDQLVCPAVCEDDGKGGCKPCPTQGACRAKLPPACQQLTDVNSCSTRADCEWEALACPAVCEDDGKGGCLPCNAGLCKPQSAVQ